MAAALAALALLASACTSLVRPPAEPADPQRVFLVYSGRHRGLILPMERDVAGERAAWVEYGYGDHDWYALQRNRWYHVFDTVLWPTQGTLGRRELPAEPGGRPSAPGTDRLVGLVVASERARALERRLARRWEAGLAEGRPRDAYGLSFVPADPGFWAFYNCTDAVAGWLESLGCDVSPGLVRLDLSVREAPRGE